MIQPTTIEAYYEIEPTLGRRQQQVLDLLIKYQALSNNEISRKLKKRPSDTSGRIKELREKGLIYISGFKYDNITNKRNHIYSLKE